MKKLPFIFAIAFSFFASGNITAQVKSQQKGNQKQEAIENLISSQRFTFIPSTVLPMSGMARPVTSAYQLNVKNDSLVCYLPYFGKAYTASIGSTESPLDFKTNDFKYSKTNHKKGGWDITIVPKNAGDARQLTLYISQDGYASLRVICNNRDAISFDGYIQ